MRLIKPLMNLLLLQEKYRQIQNYLPGTVGAGGRFRDGIVQGQARDKERHRDSYRDRYRDRYRERFEVHSFLNCVAVGYFEAGGRTRFGAGSPFLSRERTKTAPKLHSGTAPNCAPVGAQTDGALTPPLRQGAVIRPFNGLLKATPPQT